MEWVHGEKAAKSSSTVISMLKKMLTNGFDKEVSIGLINSAININSSEETYATIDLSIVDLNNGNIEFVKYEDNIVYIRMMGACANCQMLDVTLKEGIETAIMHKN